MAETIKGINVVIGAETTGLSKALSDVNKKSRDIQTELKQVEKLLKLDPGNTDLLAQKQKLLSDAIVNTANKLDSLRAAQQQVNEQFSKGEINEGQYRAFQRELAKTEQELKGLDGKLDETTNTLKNQGVAVSQLGKDYQESFEQAKQAVGNSFEQMKKAGAGITALGGGIAAGLGVAVKVAADNETQLAKMETALQGNAEAAKEYVQWAKQFGKDTPFEANEVVDATVKLKAYGIEAKDTMTSIGNMAAGMGKGLDQAVEAVADAQTGELERLKEFGITKQMLIDKALQLGKGEVVNAKGQITDMKSLNDALFAIMDERFKGGMERQSKTLNGQLSALKDSMTQTLAGIGEVLLPIITQIVGAIQKIADGFANMSPGMQKFIAIGGAVTAALALIAGPLLMLIGFLPSIIAGFTALGPVMAALTGPVGLIVAAIAALVAGLIYLYNNNETVKNALNAAWEWLKSAAESIFNALKEFWAKWGDDILAFFQATWDVIKTVFETVFSVISTIVTTVFEAIREFWDKWGDTIVGIFKNYFEILKIFWTTVFNAIVAIVKGIFNGLKSFWDKWGTTITAVFKTVLGVVKSIFEGTWNAIKIVIETVIGVISGIVKTWLAIFKGDWSGAWEGMKETVSAIWTGITDLFKNAFNTMKDIGKNIIQGLIDGIKGMKDAVVQTAKDVANSIGNGVKDFFGIHSPSRLMLGYGKNIVQGLANGISETARQAVKSASAVSSAVSDAMSLNVGGLSAAANSALNGSDVPSVAGNNQINVSFADMLRGANFVVRNDNDITKIAQQLGGVVNQNLRALGGAN